MKKRIVSLLLVLCLFFSIQATGAASQSDALLTYEAAVRGLGSVTLMDLRGLEQIIRSLRSVGDKDFAPQYRALAQALLTLARREDSRLEEVESSLRELSTDQAFMADYLANDSLKPLPIDALLRYVVARQLEAQGKTPEAAEAYAQAQVLDSPERARRMDAKTLTALGTAMPESTPEPLPLPQATPPESDFKYTLTGQGTVILTGYSGSAEEITIPATLGGYSVVEIGNQAFYSNHLLTAVSLPDTLLKIGSNAFYDCSKLQSIKFPETLRIISERAFYGCSSLQRVSIPAGVEDIQSQAFGYCPKLISFSVDAVNPYYASFDSVLYNRQLTELLAYPLAKEGSSYVIKPGTETIKVYAFGNSTLEAIVIPDSVRLIETQAFWACPNLKEINLPEGVEQIGDSAFRSCRSMLSVRLPASLAEIGPSVFAGCSSLTQIIVNPGNTVYLSLDGVVYSSSMDTLVVYPAGREQEFYQVSEGIVKVAKGAFTGSLKLKGIGLPQSLVLLEDVSFNESGLTSVTIPPQVKTIGYGAFMYCINLESVIIPPGVESIGDNLVMSASLAVLRVSEDSFAHAYAMEKNIPFVLEGSVAPPEASAP